MRTRVSITLPVFVAVLVTALVLGGVGSATAGQLTTKTVRKIATKVIKKKARALSVAHATSAGSATSAGDAALLGGAAPATYLDRGVHQHLTGGTNLSSGSATSIIGPTTITVPAGVGYLHITGVATFSGATPDVSLWPSLDGVCAVAGDGYAHRSVTAVGTLATAAIDYLAPVTAGPHAVRLCALASSATTATFRSLSVVTVAQSG